MIQTCGNLYDLIKGDYSDTIYEDDWMDGLKILNSTLTKNEMKKLFTTAVGSQMSQTKYIDRNEWIDFCESNRSEYLNLVNSISLNIESTTYHAGNNEKLRELLQTTQLISLLPKQLLLSCTKQIIDDIFGGMDNILNFLVIHSSKQKVNKIHNMINIEYIKYKKSKLNSKNNEEMMETENESNFGILSTDSISYICGFLEEDDINNFKLVSRRISIGCLQEMTKLSIAILNMNECINGLYKKYYKNIFDFKPIIKKHRHNGNKTIQYLTEFWQKQYDIDIENQLVIHTNSTVCNPMSTEIDILIQEVPMNTKMNGLFAPKSYLLFDKTNIIKIEKQNARIMNTNETLQHNERIIILKYFDIHNQNIEFVQYLIIANDIQISDICKYIQTKFISTNHYQNNWIKKLKYYMKEMELMTSDQPPLCYWRFMKNFDAETIELEEIKLDETVENEHDFLHEKCITLIMQLNHHHKYIHNYCQKHNISQDALKLYRDIKYGMEVYVKSMHDLSTLTFHVNSIGGNNSSTKIIDQFENTASNKGKMYKILLDDTFMELRVKIANDLGINANNIELYDEYYEYLYPCYDAMDGYTFPQYFTFEVVSYDIEHENNESVYRIAIYPPSGAPFPFYKPNINKTLSIGYSTEFKVQDFVDDIHAAISKPMYAEQFADILSEYNDNDGDIEMFMHHCVVGSNLYKMDDEFENNQDTYCTAIDIFMIRTDKQEADEDEDLIPIQIQFMPPSNADCWEYDKFVGLPLNVRIKHASMLKPIIDEIEKLHAIKKYIDYSIAYKCVNTDELKEISFEYKPQRNDIVALRVNDAYKSDGFHIRSYKSLD